MNIPWWRTEVEVIVFTMDDTAHILTGPKATADEMREEIARSCFGLLPMVLPRGWKLRTVKIEARLTSDARVTPEPPAW